MSKSHSTLAERSGGMVESHKGYDPRIVFFYFLLALMLVILAGGLGYQQLTKEGVYDEKARIQNSRQVLVPGARGNILDRNGQVLVTNKSRWTVVLHLDELRSAVNKERGRIAKNYREAKDYDLKDQPSSSQLLRLARVSVVQDYLDQVNAVLATRHTVDADALDKHFLRELLIPFTLVDGLDDADFARLIERIPVNSPLDVQAVPVRYYPFHSAAAHTLGYVRAENIVDPESSSEKKVQTFRGKNAVGVSGLELKFDDHLQGIAGRSIYRVDPSGYRIEPPLERVKPAKGNDLVTSLDIDLQVAAEAALTKTEMAGTAVAMDVATGEVLVLASKPDYNLNDFSPRLSHTAWADIMERGAAFPRAVQGAYPPGSAFKILLTIAALRSGTITPASRVDCPGFYRVGRAEFDCHDRHAHGDIGLTTAIEKSCNVFYYKYGMEMGPDVMAAEARRFRLDRPTGIELSDETRRMLIPDPAWKIKNRGEGWVGGDTAQMAIGQSFLLVTPLQMAAFTASVARGETWTQPTILHQASRPRQRTEPIGLSGEQRAVLLRGMEDVTGPGGTAKILLSGTRGLSPLLGLRVAGKTGTAQSRTTKGIINFAWFIAFAPIENPEIAIAIAIEGDTPGEETGGGLYAVPVAHAILKTWMDKKAGAGRPTVTPIKFR